MKRFPALKYHDFRLLWIGQLISLAGTEMQMVTINWHIYTLTHSALALGLVGLTRFTPIVFFSLIGGAFSDAYNRKKLMVVAALILAIFSTMLGIATIRNSISPLIIYALTALSAIVVSFDLPARQAFIPSLVKKEHLENAMSLNVIMYQSATIIGPMLAGVLIAKTSLGHIYILNAITYIIVTGCLILMKTSGKTSGKIIKPSLQAVSEGITFVKSKTIIWSTMILDFFSTFFASAMALLPVFAKDILSVGPTALGFLYAAPSIGAVLAGLAVAHLGTLSKQGRLLLWSVSIYAAATILFGISKLFLLSFFALLLVGAGDSISAIIRNTLRQLETPDYIRGRMVSINMIFFLGGPQLGEFEAGLLAFFVGAPYSVILGGVGTLFVVAIIALLVPSVRKYDKHLISN